MIGLRDPNGLVTLKNKLDRQLKKKIMQIEADKLIGKKSITYLAVVETIIYKGGLNYV